MLDITSSRSTYINKSLFYSTWEPLSVERYKVRTIDQFDSGLILGTGNHASICKLIKVCKQVSPKSSLSIVANKHMINSLSANEFGFLHLIKYHNEGLLKLESNPSWWKQLFKKDFDSIFFHISQKSLIGIQNILELLHFLNSKALIYFTDQEGNIYQISQGECSESLKSILIIDQMAELKLDTIFDISKSNKKPCILFDSRILGEKKQTGVHRYARELINYLPREIPNTQFQSIGCETIPLSEDISRIPVSLPLSDLQMANNLLTLTSQIEKTDLIFSPYHPIPKKRIGLALLTIHDLIPLVHPEWFSNPTTIKFFDETLRESAVSVDKIIADSNSTKKDIIDIYGIDGAKVEVIHLAAHSIFCPSNHNVICDKHFGFTNGRPYFLSVCTQEPRKNLVGVIKAYDLLRKQNPSLDPALVLVGKKGWKNDELERTLKESNFKDSIFITGYIEDNTLVNAYREAIAFIYPSFYEGFGLPVLEAMSCGTPVITSNNSSLPEIGKDSVLYCDPSSLEDISSAMERVSTDSLLGEKLSNLGLRRAEYFSWKKTAQKTAQVISSLLN
jgi:glycosyltransferase involved in cell wall biosynthesis